MLTLLRDRQTHIASIQQVRYLSPVLKRPTYADPIYCQSSERLNNPSPSFAPAPPNMFVKMFTTFFDAR